MLHPRRLGLGLALALALLGSRVVADEAPVKKLGETSGERLLNDALGKLKARFYDKKRAVDWDGLARRYRDDVRASATPREAHQVVNRLLGELKTSHLSLLEGSVYDRELGCEFNAQRTVRAGCELVDLEGKLFLGSVAEDGPAARAGLLQGDEIVAIDGVPALEAPRLEDAGHDPGLPGPPSYVLAVKKGEKIPLVVRRRAGDPARKLVLVPEETSLLESSRASVRVAEVRGKKIARIHLWHFQTFKMNDVLTEALEGPLARADALVLDVRGRGGHAGMVNAVLQQIRGSRARWRKPVVCLIDRGTRSAKEVFAYEFRKQEVGKIVGERTAGAVIGCAFEKLFDGSMLCLPIQDVRRMTGGETLEGKGVGPDVEVDPGPLPYRGGVDRIGDRGEEVAADRAREVKKREFH